MSDSLPQDDDAVSQPYSFITFGGPTDSSTIAGKKAVRAEAARRSASQRQATLAQRHQVVRWANQSDPSEKVVKKQKGKQPSSSGRGQQPTINAAALVGHMVPKLVREDYSFSPLRKEPSGASLLPYQQTIGRSDWQPNLVTMINTYLDSAMDELFLTASDEVRYRLRMQGMAPYIFSEPALYRTLGLLTATVGSLYPSGTNEKPVVLWLKQNVLSILARTIAERGAEASFLAPAMALMAGYEKEFGEFNASLMHINALKRVIEIEGGTPEEGRTEPTPAKELPGYPFPASATEEDTPMRDDNIDLEPKPSADPKPHDLVQVLEAAYHRNRVMPPGFAFLHNKKLLPPSLVFNVSQLAHIDVNDSKSLVSLNCIGIACFACRPWTEEGLSAVKSKGFPVLVATHVRFVGGMLTLFMYTAADENSLPATVKGMGLSEGIQAAWQDTQFLGTEKLVGTVYDEVLLWCLAVFYVVTLGKATEDQKSTMRRLLDNLLVDRYSEFEALMERFIKQPCMEPGLLMLWNELRPRAAG
ncbi:hypothetical protein KC360_g3833 [Hortaea werneckii]|nr:hypothetical protein KC325_g3739 [Hortaea werneckii]KAI6994755.1 hypothetical protein KC359_g4483 [Hortaea werneckii]KAI7143130.1 hypothetical protein KC344_g6581 [Hortaea werneckii]KAI7175136.1 hypothetical protein KC360_g3833 [Hortaea werneckii]